jgi:hypothetical protein
MKYSLGIDNGLKGCLALINENFELIDWQDTPVVNLGAKGKTKNDFATAEMGHVIRRLLAQTEGASQTMVWLEVAQAMPKQGLSSTFKTGRGFGLWEGICIGLKIKYDIVHPRTWTKVMLHDVPRGEPKARSMAKCQRLFPDLPLTTPRGTKLTMDGRADAALIAYYGLLQMTSQEAPTTHKAPPKSPPRRKSKLY